MFDSLLIRDFIPPDALERITGSVHSAAGVAAEVYGSAPSGAVDARVRSARKLAVPDGTRDEAAALLEGVRETLARHFGVALTSFEIPQFLRYEPGDFFVPHQDGNTPMIHDDSMHRRVSVVVFLNSPSPEPREGAYGGGELTLHGRYPDYDVRHVVPASAGALVAFRSETTHEVTPVAHGERYTIVSWYR